MNSAENNSISSNVRSNCQIVKKASITVANLITGKKNQFLYSLARRLNKQSDLIIQHNAKDITRAVENNLTPALIDRLTLDAKRIQNLAKAVEEIANLPDPIGELTNGIRRPNGLLVYQERIPLGTIMVIFESRPNVIIDIASLAIKSGNTAILKGGKEAIATNTILTEIIKQTLEEHQIPKDSIYLINTSNRDEIKAYLSQSDLIDVVIPRGGEKLIEWVSTHSKIPVIKHDKGLCHLYIDELPLFKQTSEEDQFKQMIVDIVINSKVQKPGVCNSIETLLIHKDYPDVEKLLTILTSTKVELRLDASLHKKFPQYQLASEEDWSTEYLDLILSVKVIQNIEEAVSWINHYGSHHTDVILSRNHQNINYFKTMVDSSCIVVNASSRFNDGGMLGLGAEVGISNQKIHVRGPMGIRDLTCLKYQVEGNGQIR